VDFGDINRDGAVDFLALGSCARVSGDAARATAPPFGNNGTVVSDPL